MKFNNIDYGNAYGRVIPSYNRCSNNCIQALLMEYNSIREYSLCYVLRINFSTLQCKLIIAGTLMSNMIQKLIVCGA
jgi:hypothetical protein